MPTIADRYNFLADLRHDEGPWFSHRALLLLALEQTRGSPHPILELGMGDGSTPQLHAYAEGERRRLFSMDNNPEQFARFARMESPLHTIRCVHWDHSYIEAGEWSVALVDHAPPEQRRLDILKLLAKTEILVIHDSEPSAEGYRLREIWPIFRYRADINLDGVGTTAVSNVVDLRGWAGMEFDELKVDCR